MIHMTEEEYQSMRSGQAPKRSKYGAKRTESGFDSHKEEKRYLQLLLLERAGEIKNLSRQVPFTLKVNGVVIGKIVLDFVYERHICGRKHECVTGWAITHEDVKGSDATISDLWKWKAKHFTAQYGVKVEVWK
jgi:hypothetical protein